MDRKNGKLMENKKFEVIAHEVVEHLYIIEAEDMDEAINQIK